MYWTTMLTVRYIPETLSRHARERDYARAHVVHDGEFSREIYGYIDTSYDKYLI
jgi:hypothetical protein